MFTSWKRGRMDRKHNKAKNSGGGSLSKMVHDSCPCSALDDYIYEYERTHGPIPMEDIHKASGDGCSITRNLKNNISTLGLQSSKAVNELHEANGAIQRFLRTLKESEIQQDLKIGRPDFVFGSNSSLDTTSLIEADPMKPFRKFPRSKAR